MPDLGETAWRREIITRLSNLLPTRDAARKRAEPTIYTTLCSSFARAIIVDSPPSLDDHEVTDKGSINQRAVMAARAHLIEDIYAGEPGDHVLVTNRQAKA